MTLHTDALWIPLAADGTTQVQHSAEALRALNFAMASRPGVVRPGAAVGAGGNQGDFAATVVPGALQLTIAPGYAFVPGRETTLQGAGNYLAYGEVNETVTWPANASGSSRMDSLILRIADPQYGSIGGHPLGAYWDAVAGSSGSARPDSDFLAAGSQYVPGGWLRAYDWLITNGATQLVQGNGAFKAGYSNALGYTPAFAAALPSTGRLGESLYELDTGFWREWTGAAWTLRRGQSAWVEMSSDQTVNNTSTLVNITSLVLPVVANATYAFEANLFFTSGSTPDIKFAVVTPAGATTQWWSLDAFNTTWVRYASGGAVAIGTAGTEEAAELRGSVLTGATAGNIQLQFAQNGANASNTIVRAHSSLTATRRA